MGGNRKPFHVRAKAGSAFWWADFTIKGKRYRPVLDLTRADDPDQRRATQAAGTLWLEERCRQGIKAAAPPDLDTETLIIRYVATELAAQARKRAARYLQIEKLRLNLHVVPRFPLVNGLTADAWDLAVADMHGRLKLDTIRKITFSACVFLRWCAKIGAIALVPALRAPSDEECALELPERRAFTREERDRFLLQLDGRPRRVYTVLLYTALRKISLERMLPRWINWQTGYVVFPGLALKKRKPKAFFLRKEAQDAIREEMAARGSLDPDKPVFGKFDFDGHNGAARSGIFWTACRAAGIPLQGLTAHHVCRHTAATIAGNDGATLAELMRLGGWETPAMAMRYMHASDEQARKVVERL
jgi:integrase